MKMVVLIDFFTQAYLNICFSKVVSYFISYVCRESTGPAIKIHLADLGRYVT